jgi:hypothetical protein
VRVYPEVLVSLRWTVRVLMLVAEHRCLSGKILAGEKLA